MTEIFVYYSETLSIFFIGLLGGVVGLIFDEDMISLKRIIVHLFLGIMAANFVGHQLCLWKEIEHCEFFQIVAACTGNSIFLFITGGAKQVLISERKIVQALIKKYIRDAPDKDDQ